MNTTKRIFMAALTLVAFSSTAAIADDIEKKCRIYANTAIAQNNVAVKLKCGYGWPVWSNDFMHHYGWCLRGNNHKHAKWGTEQRIAGLKKCKGK